MEKKRKLYKYILVGQLVINLPVVLFCWGVPALLGFLIENRSTGFIVMILGFFVGIAVSWLWWSYFITKWRLWAFNKVEENDWIRLKKMAISNKLIWYDNSWFEKTEIRTTSEHEKITLIAENIQELEEAKEIEYSLNVPDICGYKLSKIQNITESTIMILVLFASIGTFFTEVYFLGIIIILIVVTNLKNIKYLPASFVDDNYLELRKEGIQIGFIKEEFIKWERIEFLTIDKEKRTLILEVNKQGKEDKIKFALWRLESYDYDEFNRNLNIFMERFWEDIELHK